MKQRSAGKPDIELGKRIRLRRVEQKISLTARTRTTGYSGLLCVERPEAFTDDGDQA